MLKKIFVTIISLFLLTQPLLSDEKEDLINLLGKKENLDGKQFYHSLSELQEKWATDILYGIGDNAASSDSLEQQEVLSFGTNYALDARCLNDCKIYKSPGLCKRICLIPADLLNQSLPW